jgi:acetoin:2,6-dichlorophenolindophenol oxidoreductase subunit alpha
VASKEFLEELYRTLYTIRIFETRCIQLYRQGFIKGYFHPYLGEEAIAAGVCAALRKDDLIISTHRGHGHCIAKGADLKKMVSEVLGKEAGYCHGRGGSMHIADLDTGNLGANGIVGGGIPIGVGAALSISLRQTDQVIAIFFSDGASNNGVFAESLNLAAIWNLPAIFVLENNQYAVSTPVEESSRDPDLFSRGKGYGVESWLVDGNDVLEVHQRTREAATLCREGKGPVLMCCKTYRQGGHHVNDPGLYMTKERLKYYRTHEPLTLCKEHMCRDQLCSRADIERIEKEVEQQMEEAIEYAKNSPEPSVKAFLAEVQAN